MEILMFTAALVAPMIFFRILFYLAPRYLKDPFIRSRTGVPFHHWHYGVVVVFLASLILIFSERFDWLVILFLGLGLGLILDEFIWSLMQKNDRHTELDLYRQSFNKTVVLFLDVVLVIVLLWFVLK